MKHFLLPSILLLGSTLFTLFLGEVGARIVLSSESVPPANLSEQLATSAQAAPVELADTSNLRGLIQPSDNPDIVYEMRPRLRGKFQGKYFELNSLGARGEDVSLEKPARTIRIVGIGDSVMFGWGVEQAESYFALLSQLLNSGASNSAASVRAEQPNYQFINLGTPGYNTTMEVALFAEKGLPLNPDAVVLHFVNNDWSVPQFMERPKDFWTMRRSYLWEELSRRFKSLTGFAASASPDTADLVRVNANLNSTDEVVEQYRHMLGKSGFVTAMSRLAELTKDRKIPVIVLSGSKTDEQRNTLKQVCQQFGFHLVGVGPFVEAYWAKIQPPASAKQRRKAMTVSAKDPHPNQLGHLFYAQALLAGLQELNLVPAEISLTVPVQRESSGDTGITANTDSNANIGNEPASTGEPDSNDTL